MLKIAGFQKTTLIDYPNHIASIIFLSGCNFKCPFCHNPDLVLHKNIKLIDGKEVLRDLEKRKNFIDGIVITGGEPLLYSYKDLSKFIKKIKEIDSKFLIKIDTNGTNPKLLEKLIKNKLINFVAMDIKNTKKKYNETARTRVNIVNIEESIKIINKNTKNKKIDSEFRITVLPEFHNQEDLIKIGQWLKGSKKLVLQKFIPKNTLNKSFEKKPSYSEKELKEFAKPLKLFFHRVDVRG
ncbi:anaerobic ribonucleoside-triphosphate reductase activating protein [Candidatus Pacearchaeota archaeon]|nr:anaerobic ribonucleoside-triphosphate reductase activating protein [Candidatus Pacearchaeota archaeon]